MADTTTKHDVLDDIISEGRMAKDELQLVHARDLIGEYAKEVSDKKIAPGGDLAASINQRIAQIDPLIRQLTLYRDLIDRQTGDPT